MPPQQETSYRRGLAESYAGGRMPSRQQAWYSCTSNRLRPGSCEWPKLCSVQDSSLKSVAKSCPQQAAYSCLRCNQKDAVILQCMCHAGPMLLICVCIGVCRQQMHG